MSTVIAFAAGRTHMRSTPCAWVGGTLALVVIAARAAATSAQAGGFRRAAAKAGGWFGSRCVFAMAVQVAVREFVVEAIPSGIIALGHLPTPLVEKVGMIREDRWPLVIDRELREVSCVPEEMMADTADLGYTDGGEQDGKIHGEWHTDRVECFVFLCH